MVQFYNYIIYFVARKNALTEGLSRYFKRHPALLDEVVLKMDKGKYLAKLRQETITAIQQSITPAVALAIKVV